MYKPRPGDIGLTSIEGRVGFLIRVGQALNGTGFNDYQHAFVVLDGPRQIVEAEPGGAIVSDLSKYDGRHVVYLRCPDGLRDEVAYQATTLIGIGYSFADYASLAARRLHVPAPHLRAFIRDSGHQICSQLADCAAMRGGWHLFSDQRWSGDVTPGDLYQLYRKQQAKAGTS